MDLPFLLVRKREDIKENRFWEEGLSGARSHVGGIIHTLLVGQFLQQALDDGIDVVHVILLLGDMLLHEFSHFR